MSNAIDKECQLIAYNESEYSVLENSAAFFTDYFPNVIKHKSDHVYWLNFNTLTYKNEIEQLCANLDAHRTSTEDIFSRMQRSKLEETLKTEQISFVLGKNYILSFQEKEGDNFEPVRNRLENKKGIIRTKGADYAIYRLLECIIDNFFETNEEINNQIDFLEKLISYKPEKETLLKIEFQKRRLFDLRKIVIPMRDITAQLEDIDNPLVNNKNHHFFNDIKDSCLTVIDEMDAGKQILDSLTNLHYASMSHRMNEIMKLLTIVNTIFVPLTFLVGVYGMNFDIMPELRWKYGYFMAWGSFIIITVSLLFYFKKRKWL
jgi:magnesium transporter